MIKLSQKVLSGLGKVPPMKSKAKMLGDEAAFIRTKKNRKKLGGGATSPLERTPKTDTFVKNESVQSVKGKQETQNVDTKNRLGDFLVKQNKQLAAQYMKDLEEVAQAIPEASFHRELNKSSTKELPSILDKIARRTEQFSERGYSGVIRDELYSFLTLIKIL